MFRFKFDDANNIFLFSDFEAKRKKEKFIERKILTVIVILEKPFYYT